jgi:hypothetical protein
MTVPWLAPGIRNRAAGDNVLTTDSVGICLAAGNIPQGNLMVVVPQMRVKGQ